MRENSLLVGKLQGIRQGVECTDSEKPPGELAAVTAKQEYLVRNCIVEKGGGKRSHAAKERRRGRPPHGCHVGRR